MSPTLALPEWMVTEAQALEQRRILAGRWFLVKIAGNGEVWRCKRCQGKHRYLTLMCVEQPFSGLTRGLYAYVKTIGMHGAEAYLSPAERARYRRLEHLLGPSGGAPDVASSHPLLARRFGTAERDADVGAFTFTAREPSADALGIVEPISRAKAADLARRINLRGVKPAFILEGVNDGE